MLPIPGIAEGGVLIGIVLLLGGVSVGQDRRDAGQVEALVKALTLEEKSTLLHGTEDPIGRAEAGYVPGVSRLDVPPLRMTDGRPQAETDAPSTTFPAPIALGASFDPALARRVGQARGRESRARGQNVFLGPSADLLRVPEAGRAPEMFGEDPCLIGHIIAEEVKGIQEEGVIATVRHFLAHTFDAQRDRVSVEVSDRALRELYLPGFRSAVAAGVGSVMGAPNRINGTFACDHEWLLTDLLKEELGFEGWVMSSWFARHSLGALQAGLDQEMPGTDRPGAPQAVYFDEPLRRAVRRGQIPVASVDASVRRILRTMRRMGLLDDTASPTVSVDRSPSTAVAREAALSGAVLLRNENETLPLAVDALSSLAVIGPAAERPPRIHRRRNSGGHSGESALSALRRRLTPEASLCYKRGLDPDGITVPASALSPSGGLNLQGLRRTSADQKMTIDSVVDVAGSEALPAESSWTWAGTLTAPQTGDYTLRLQTKGGWGRLSVDGSVLATTGNGPAATEALSPSMGGSGAAGVLHLEAGEPRRVEITVDGSGGADPEPLAVRFSWVPPDRRRALRRQAVVAAREADAALVFGHGRASPGSDGSSLSLPPFQDALIRAVSDASPSTTVVLHTGGPVLMPWLDAVDAALQMWDPGREGGEATAALLTGAAVPGGRLPVTFPRRPEDAPTHAPERHPGVNGRVQHAEDVFVGYRWYDQQAVEPLFPFGHGLTYTTFAYSDLSVRGQDPEWTVQFRVENTGERTGVAVPQVYVGRPSNPSVPMPPKELVGFERIELSPGEAATVTTTLDRRALSYWSEAEDRWRVASGSRPVYVGSSARHLRLETTLRV